MYVPSSGEDRSYAVFTTNRDVPIEQMLGFITRESGC